MKHKIIILFIVMVAMLIAAVCLYNSAIALSGRWGISVRGIDAAAKALFVLSFFPSIFINSIRKEAKGNGR